MPELPEVEVTRLSFAQRIRGARCTAVRVGKPLRWPLGRRPQSLVGLDVGEVTRRQTGLPGQMPGQGPVGCERAYMLRCGKKQGNCAGVFNFVLGGQE